MTKTFQEYYNKILLSIKSKRTRAISHLQRHSSYLIHVPLVPIIKIILLSNKWLKFSSIQRNNGTPINLSNVHQLLAKGEVNLLFTQRSGFGCGCSFSDRISVCSATIQIWKLYVSLFARTLKFNEKLEMEIVVKVLCVPFI